MFRFVWFDVVIAVLGQEVAACEPLLARETAFRRDVRFGSGRTARRPIPVAGEPIWRQERISVRFDHRQAGRIGTCAEDARTQALPVAWVQPSRRARSRWPA